MRRIILSLAWTLAIVGSMQLTAEAIGEIGVNSETNGWVARNVAIVVYDEVEPLDFVGPGEVFGAAANAAGIPGRPAFNVYTVATSTDPIRSRFMTLKPDFTLTDCPKPDIIVIPGGSTRKLLENAAFMKWIEANAEKETTVLTVCTGARVLAELGLLNGKQATTHHGIVPFFRSTYPEVQLVENARFVEQSNFITSAGVSAGIDSALHLVAKLHGRKVALRTASYMEYNWQPDLKMFAKYPDHNPLLNAKEQLESDLMIAGLEQDTDGIIKYASELLKQRPGDRRLRYQLGHAQLTSRNLDDAIATFSAIAKSDDAAFKANALYNVACAYALKGEKVQAVEALRLSFNAGYADMKHARTDNDLAGLRGMPEFEQLLEND